MKYNSPDEAKKWFEKYGCGSMDEWEYFESLTFKSNEDRLELLKWIFEEGIAYWKTRAEAGLILLNEDESYAWQVILNLINSSDPDDNGTALTIFEKTNDPRAPELILKWLDFSYHVGTQIEAVEFLKDFFSEKAFAHAKLMAEHNNKFIRESGTKLFKRISAT